MAELLRDANGKIIPQFFDRNKSQYLPVSIRNVDRINPRDTYLKLDNTGQPYPYQYLDTDGNWYVYRTATPPQGVSSYPNIISKVVVERIPEAVKGDTGPQGPAGPQGPQPPLENSLTSTSTTTAVTAAKAKELNDKVTTINSQLSNKAEVTYVNQKIKAEIEDYVVTPENTNFFIVGKNLFNLNDAIVGSYVNETNGSIGAYGGYVASAFIEVIPATKYTRNFSHKMAFYDEQKSYISGINTNANVMAITTFQTPANCKYVRVTVSESFSSSFQLEIGESNTAYEPYKVALKTEIIPETVLSPYIANSNNIAEKIVTPEKTTFIQKSKNLFNKNAVTKNSYVANTTGEIGVYSGFNASEFIKVKPSTTYTRSYSHRMAFYTDSKVYISGDAPSTDAASTFTTPSNCGFLRLTVSDAKLNTMQLEEGSMSTNYEDFGMKLDTELTKDLEYTNPISYSAFNKNKHRMLLAPKMFFVEGDTLPIYRSSFMTGNEDFSVNTLRTAIVHENSLGEPTFNYFYEDFEIDPLKIPSNFKVYMKGNRNETKLYYSHITKVSTDKTSKAGLSPKILTIGDSLTNRATVTYLKQKLEQYGLSPIMLGTYFDTLGTRTEARGGWEYDNFIGRDNKNFSNTISLPSYPATSTNVNENPFLKIATTEDKNNYPNWCFRNSGSNIEKSYASDTDKSGNFYIFDINHYLSSFSVATPDVVLISLGTNDMVQEGDAESIASMRFSLEVLIKRIKHALPNVKIGIVPTVCWWIGKDSWDTEVASWIENCITDVLSYTNQYNNLDVIPAYAHINRDFIYPYATTTHISSVNREIEATISDDLHFDPSGRRQYAKALASYVMNVI